MRPWLLIVAFAFSIGAAMAEDLPPAVQKAIAENKRGCKTVAIEKGFITRKDINGDGRPDFVLDYESFTCDGNRRCVLRLDRMSDPGFCLPSKWCLRKGLRRQCPEDRFS